MTLLDTRRRLAMRAGKYVVNPVVRFLVDRGIPLPGTAILETTGRKSGLTRRNPVTDGLDGDVFWLVSEHGRRSSYVRNLEANPRVRVKVGRTWRTGTATPVDDDDPARRLAYIRSIRRGSWLNARMVSVLGTDRLTIRIDLDPQ